MTVTRYVFEIGLGVEDIVKDVKKEAQGELVRMKEDRAATAAPPHPHLPPTRSLTLPPSVLPHEHARHVN
jgi:hypothetical protein